MGCYDMLENLDLPKDLKKLGLDQLNRLCSQIRSFLIERLSLTGGHLSSNLGVVELTVALHYVFDSPCDRIVFDVGHQSYVHKILTGRMPLFSTLRRYGGLSGFMRPSESLHDPVVSGHSSTSISSALGLEKAASLSGAKNHVVAVIGDGAMTGGLAYEGLINAGRSNENLTVVLNDNGMSISKSVGSLARYLARVRSRPEYFRIKDASETLIGRIPLVGRGLERLIKASKSAVKSALLHGTIFEQMGFEYLGPADGHDLEAMIVLLRRARELKKPALVHLVTVKGKGYAPAESDPARYHGVPRYDIESGDMDDAAEGSFSEEMGKALCELAQNDQRICAITAAMPTGTGLDRFSREYKSRFFNVGIAEQHAVTFAGGLAAGGMLPLVAVYSSFLQRAYDQIIHDVAIQGLKVVLAVDRAGLVGEDGETHHGIFDVSYLSGIPGLTVLSPSNLPELRAMLAEAFYDLPGPVAIRYPKGTEHPRLRDVAYDGRPFSVFYADAANAAIITYGRLAGNALDAADILRRDGLRCCIVKLNAVNPLPEGAVSFLADKGIGAAVFFEEGIKAGGIGERLGSLLAEKGVRIRYGVRAVKGFVPHGSTEELMRACGLDARGMAEFVREVAADGAVAKA